MMQKQVDPNTDGQKDRAIDAAPKAAAVEEDAAPKKQAADDKAGAAAILRMAETNLAGAWQHVHDGVMNGAGEAVGWAEMLGLRYPVKAYEAQVDGNLYRGSRVDFQGMAALKAQGITGIVNLCAENNNDQAMALKLGMTPLHIPVMDNAPPTRAQIQQFLSFASSTTPCYVHCEAGVGRTGTFVASYRMAIDGWTGDQAIAEARKYGLAMPNQIAFLQEFAASLSGADASTQAPPDSGNPKNSN